MKRLIFPFFTAFCLLMTSNNLNAQQNQPFSLDNLFNMDIGELFNQLEQEMEETENIWGQFINPGMMDSSMHQLKGVVGSGIFDTIFNQLQLEMGNMGAITNMIDQLMGQLNIGGMQSMPFNFNMPNHPNQATPKDFKDGEWEVVPNIPNSAPKQSHSKEKVYEL